MVSEINNISENEKRILLQILKALRDIKYGCVQIFIQDSKVVQIDKTEKIRLEKEKYTKIFSGG